jgi:outer membrane protein OmpA-like peptidoglycan-associated protein
VIGVVAAAATAATLSAVLLPEGAGAVNAIVVSPTTTTLVSPSSTTTLAGLGVSGDPTDTLQVTVATSVGTLTLSSHANLTLSYNNHWSGDASITFTGLQADINTALAAAQLVSGANAGSSAAISLTAMVSQPSYIYLAPNQHFYQYVAAPGTTWTAANTAAQALSFQGQQGYLATIPNNTVNDFISSKIQGAQNVWFGAKSTDTPGSPTARTWKWTGGPLAGNTISTCSNFLNTCDFVNNTGLYSHWASGEPNNYGGTAGSAYSGEWVAVTNWSGSVGQWNDLAPSWSGLSAIAGYVVEYGDQAVGSSGFTGVVSTSSNVLIAGVPAKPTGVSASRGDSKATVSFVAPASNGSAITSYTVTAGPGGATATCAGSPCTVTGLTNGTSYTFTVHATNAIGDGPESSASSAVTPARAPDAPLNPAVTVGNGSVTVTFDPPADNGGSPILNYTVAAAGSGGGSVTCSGSPCTLSGLTNGTSYAVTVRANNAVGPGSVASAGSAIPVTAPSAPSTPTVERGDSSAVLTFTPGSDGGSAITGYVVTVHPGGATQNCDESPCTVTGLTNGDSYTFTVAAVNDAGIGAPSANSAAVTPAGVPFAPDNLEVTRGNGSATLTFDAAGGNGSPVTGYEYSTDGGTSWHTLATSGNAPVTGEVDGLTNGTSYDFRVHAVNGVGAGAATADGSATPATRPDGPTAVAGSRAGDGKVSVSFSAPLDNGGDPITSYTVTSAPEGLTATCDGSPCVVEGLTNGTAYTFTVVATNSVGDSVASVASSAVTPAVAPGAPTGLVVTSSNDALVLSFTAPADDGGDAILGYEYSTDGGLTWHALTTSGSAPITGTVAGLTNGTDYAVKVRAVNSVGVGASTASVHGTPATVPGAPQAVTVAVTGVNAVVAWNPPADNGGSPIVSYTVTAQPGGQQCTTTHLTCTITGLQPGLKYTFAVRASNAVAGMSGTGVGAPRSTPSTMVSGKPTAPRALKPRGTDRSITVQFAPPASDGGSAITAYQVSIDGGKHWALLRTSGTGALRKATITGVLNGRSYRVSVRAMNANGIGPAAAVKPLTMPMWFHDPVSKSSRKHEISVPAHPSRYHGKKTWTTARSRSHNGTPAWNVAALHRRQLQRGQAAGLGSDGLFAFDSTVLTTAGRSAVKALVRSLRYDKSVVCEGYADFGGVAKHQNALSVQRARVVCAALRQYGAHVTTKVVGYGGTRPVVVGGTPSQRAANRRVIVLITG